MLRFLPRVARLILRREWSSLKQSLNLEYKHYLTDEDNSVSPFFSRLLISGEDHRYFGHNGIDLIAICRVLWRRLAWGVREGASTIEMQTVRILTRRYERTFRRKIKEMLLATSVTYVISKEELPAVYLRIAYFGWRMNGLNQACRRLDLNSSFLTFYEAAALIARLKYPEPRQAPLPRRKQILRRAQHLIKLHQRHSEQGVYELLDGGGVYGALHNI